MGKNINMITPEELSWGSLRVLPTAFTVVQPARLVYLAYFKPLILRMIRISIVTTHSYFLVVLSSSSSQLDIGLSQRSPNRLVLRHPHSSRLSDLKQVIAPSCCPVFGHQYSSTSDVPHHCHLTLAILRAPSMTNFIPYF